MTEKTCRNCGEGKPLAAYYKHPQMMDGHLNVCRDCVKARVRQHRRENDSVREYDRERSKRPERQAIRKANAVARRVRDPEGTRLKTKAHNSVTRAIRAGLLSKPRSCTLCSRPSDRLESHHADYTKPLDVVWLCPQCHRRIHALFPDHVKAA